MPRPLPAATHNLRQGLPDASAFPRNAWAASTRRAMNAAPDDAFGPTDPRGRVELRRALAEYLARARGVRTDAEHIVVCSGVAHALRILYGASGSAPVLGGRLAVESYGLPFHHSLLTDAGVTMQTIPVDEHGADPAALAASPHASRAVLLTPAHQFPTGVPLHPSRRTAFADWARGGRRLILEDDYDGEFRYDRQPVGALQALDPERVVYLGSASKSLSPGLRIGWMVLPDALLDAVLGAKGVREGWVGAIGQLTLADFIESGSYDKHVRRTRQKYRDRRDRLAAALDEHAPGVVSMTGIAAGLHAVLRLPAGTERSVLKAAAWHGVALDGLSSFAARLPAPAAPRRSVDASRRSAPSLRRPVDAPAREPSSLRRSVDSPVHPEPALQTLAARPDAFPEVSNPDGLVVGYAAPSDSAFPAALAALLRILPA